MDHHLLDLLLTDSPNYFLNAGVMPSISDLDHAIIYGEFKILKPQYDREIMIYLLKSFLTPLEIILTITVPAILI